VRVRRVRHLATFSGSSEQSGEQRELLQGGEGNSDQAAYKESKSSKPSLIFSSSAVSSRCDWFSLEPMPETPWSKASSFKGLNAIRVRLLKWTFSTFCLRPRVGLL